MGAWGPGLYQDDIAEDVRDYYKDQLHKGKTGKIITQELIAQNEHVISDSDNAPIFWFALADTQWNLGRLENFVKDQALRHISDGSDLKRWTVLDQQAVKKRTDVLAKLQLKLLTPQPAEKKVSQYKLYHCEWKIGDVFAYQLECNLARELGLYGRYFLIQKIDEDIWYPGHIVPIVRVKLTIDSSIPHSKEDINKSNYVQVSSKQFDPFIEEFRINSKNLTKTDFWKKVDEKKISYSYDEFGFLPIYQLKLITTSLKSIPKKLIMIGNFSEIASPQNEFIPKNKIELPSVKWNEFENTVIDYYQGYNLRKFDIYHQDNTGDG